MLNNQGSSLATILLQRQHDLINLMMTLNNSFKQAIILILFLLTACNSQATRLYEKQTTKQFEDVLQDVEFIITEKNFRITNRMHIGEAIQERGAENFPRNEVILFCNLTLAEDMLLLEPRYINYCPYKIAIAEINGQIILSTLLLPENTGSKNLDAIAEKINKILRIMIEYGASEDPFILENSNDSSGQI